ERYITYLFDKVLNKSIPLHFPRLTYKQSMEDYGSDKPDTRFEMKIKDISHIVKNCNFSVFTTPISEGGCVKAICAKDAVKTLTRKEIDKLTEGVRGSGAKGLAWIRLTQEGVTSSFAKFMTEDEMAEIINEFDAQTGDVILIIADSKKSFATSICGNLRLDVAKKLDIIDKTKFNFLWITEMPFFEWDEDLKTYVAMHHPFTSPMDECIQYLDTDKSKVRAKAYDLVLNGVEMSSGSIRIIDPALQQKMFESLGFSDEEAYEKFGYLIDAFKFGAPPHGGMGIGLDRLVMIMTASDSLRQVVAFPKVQNASELMTMCPSVVDANQLCELGISILPKNE
ncbi:MAG: amino acid--tRNA ligase-related protein, partial [Clostridia bacterium]